MTYVPHTDADRAAMLETIGLRSAIDLFADVPDKWRFPNLDLPAPVSEIEIERELRALSGRNRHESACFLGAGTYRHYRPATVDHVIQRSEFYTSYTPYQPEISQGMLQAMFEYQSMICRLTGMDVSNASHYDGATALAEAVLMTLDATNRPEGKVILPATVHPQYREVVRAYLKGTKASIVGDEISLHGTGELADLLDDETAAIVIQQPNFFGRFEAVDGLADKVHEAGALMIVVADPISLGLFLPPGDYGADIVVADGQSLGLPMAFGGPHLGIFATRNAHVRKLVGRLVGETVDVHGQRGYVLTLATREQHIRRAKATSNICTNAALTALGAAVYLATMGKSGLRHVAELCYHKSHYAAREIAKVPGLTINPQAPDAAFFKEFVVALPKPVALVNSLLAEHFATTGGYDLGDTFPDMQGHMLLAVTEMNTKADIDRLVEGLRAAVASS